MTSKGCIDAMKNEKVSAGSLIRITGRPVSNLVTVPTMPTMLSTSLTLKQVCFATYVSLQEVPRRIETTKAHTYKPTVHHLTGSVIYTIM